MKKIMSGLAIALFAVIISTGIVVPSSFAAGNGPSDASAVPPAVADAVANTDAEKNARDLAHSDAPKLTIPSSFNVNEEIELTLDSSTGVNVGDKVFIYAFSTPKLLAAAVVKTGLKVTLPANALAGLTGVHTLAVYNNAGNLIAARAITINDNNGGGNGGAADTGDSSPFTALNVMPVVALIALAGIGFVAYRRFSADKN